MLKTKGLFSSVSLKEVKAFLPRLNYKIPTNKLREIFNDVDTRKRGEIGFDDFTILYHKIIFNENVSTPFVLNLDIVMNKQYKTYFMLKRTALYCCNSLNFKQCEKIIELCVRNV